MGFAKTNVTRLGAASGLLTCYIQQDTGHASGVHTAGLSGPGGALTYEMRTYQYDYSPNPPPPWPDYELRMYATATATGGGGVSAEETLTGLWVYNNLPPPDTGYEWTGNASEGYAAATELDSLNLYKWRDLDGELPVFSGGPTSATSPLHGAMRSVWGCTDGDTYSTSADSGVVGASDSDAGNTLTPTTGTWDYPGMSIALGVSTTPGYDVTGLIAEWTGVTYLGETVDFTGIDETTNGLRILGSVGTLQLYVVDRSLVPGGGYSFGFTYGAPLDVSYDLVLLDWDAAYASATGYYGDDYVFSIPNDDGYGRKLVAASYQAEVRYLLRSWVTEQRPWDMYIALDAAWASEQDELVDPDDLPCVIEERGLAMTLGVGEEWVDWVWLGLNIRRAHETSIQFPSDATDWPSTWGTVSGGLTVVNAGAAPRITTVTVAPAASGGAITRTLNHDDLDWLLSTAVGEGLDTYGAPDMFMYWHHSGPNDNGAPATGADVTSAMQYVVWRLDCDSEEAATLQLTVEYSTATVAWTHDNADDPVVTWTTGLTVVKSLSIADAAGQSVYFDIAAAADVNLMRIDSLELSGFNGVGADWDFVINDLVFVCSEPDGAVETGKTTFTATMPRPDDGGMPLSYTWFRLTCDGQRGALIPDEIRSPLGDNGIIGVDYRVTGATNVSRMMELHTLYGHLARLEGIEVEGITDLLDPGPQANCQNGQTEYDAAFVDAAANDMLDGDLWSGDVGETTDLPLTDDGNYTNVPVRVRVGRSYMASGTTLPIIVRKRIHGNLHGCVRSAGARVYDDEVYTFEKPVGGTVADAVNLGHEHTDKWGRWSRDTMSGGRENRLIGVSLTSDAADVATWYSTLNELRRWIGTEGEDWWQPNMCVDGAGLCWVVARNSTGAVWTWLWDADTNLPVQTGQPFSDAGYERPTITAGSDGALLVAATKGGNMLFSRSRTRAKSWAVVTTATIGLGLENGDAKNRNGVTYVCGWAANEIIFRASSATALTLEVLYDDGTPYTELVVCAADPGGDPTPWSTIQRIDDGCVRIAVGIGGDIKFYECRNYADGFTEVT